MASWLVTGAGGQLGSVLLRRLLTKGEDVCGTVSPDGPRPDSGKTEVVDLSDASAIVNVVQRLRPRRIVHAAAVSTPAAARSAPELAHQVNVRGSEILLEAAKSVGARVAYISTDMVFDGEHAPYDEAAVPNATGIYARSKLLGEQHVLAGSDTMVLRVPLMYGLPAVVRQSTFQSQISNLRTGTQLSLFTDEFRTPLWLEDAAAAIERAHTSDFCGVLHLGGPERLSRLEMGLAMARALKLRTPNIRESSRLDFDSPEPRPKDLSLDSHRFEQLFGAPPGRPMEEALAAIFPD